MNSIKRRFLGVLLLLAFNGIASAQINVTYIYDNANRLIKEIYSDGKQILYTYDELGNRISKITVSPCNNADLIISDIQITKYTPDKIYYTLQIKNVGTQTANLSSFAFAAYNSNSNTKNENSEFRSALFTGGSLPPNTTMNINYSSGFNFTNDKHYLILMADYYSSVTECVEANNNLAKLINPCTENESLSVTGNHVDKLISSNGSVTISNAFLNNVLVVGKSVSQLPNTELRNSSIAIGGCLNGGPVDSGGGTPLGVISGTSSKAKSPVLNIKFSTESGLTFELEKPSSLTISVYGNTEKSLIDSPFTNQAFESKQHNLTIDTSKWVKGQKYSIHIKSDGFTDVIVTDF